MFRVFLLTTGLLATTIPIAANADETAKHLATSCAQGYDAGDWARSSSRAAQLANVCDAAVDASKAANDLAPDREHMLELNLYLMATNATIISTDNDKTKVCAESSKMFTAAQAVLGEKTRDQDTIATVNNLVEQHHQRCGV